jgi:membrane fusion protein (multidrug efflux system)
MHLAIGKAACQIRDIGVTKSKLVIGGVLSLLIAAALWLFYGEDAGASKRGRGGMVVSIKSQVVENRQFSDIVEALGTARARESVVLTSRVSDTVSQVYFDDGDVVKGGQLLVELENTEEKAQLQEAQANLEEAESQFARIADLVQRGNASTSSRDAQKRRVDEARFRLDAVKARLADTSIFAPFDGVLGLRQVSQGSLLSSNTAITTIDAVDTIKLDFSVPERFIATMAPGQEVEAKVEAYPGRLFKGRVTTVDSRVDPVTRSVVVRAEIPNGDNALRPGLLMTVEVISRTWDALAVAEEAVVPTGGRNFVFVVSGDAAERREVNLGLRRPGYVEVLSGVAAGERVVVQGTFRLGRRGVKVKELGAAKAVGDDSSPNEKRRKAQ